MGLNPRSTVLPQQCPLSKTENCLKANNLKKETFFISAKTLLMGWNYKMTIKRNYFFWTPNSFSLGWRTGSIHVVLHYVSPSAGQPKLTWKSSTTFFFPSYFYSVGEPNESSGCHWAPHWQTDEYVPDKWAAGAGLKAPRGSTMGRSSWQATQEHCLSEACWDKWASRNLIKFNNRKSCSWERTTRCTSTVLKADYEKLDTIPFKLYNLCMVPYWSQCWRYEFNLQRCLIPTTSAKAHRYYSWFSISENHSHKLAS